MAPHLQHLSVLFPVGAEWPTAISCLALRGGRHGQLVWEDRVGDLSSFIYPPFIKHCFKCYRWSCSICSAWTYLVKSSSVIHTHKWKHTRSHSHNGIHSLVLLPKHRRHLGSVFLRGNYVNIIFLVVKMAS